MKLLFLSDLHIDVNRRAQKANLMPKLIAYIKKQAPDYLIIAGDLWGSAKGAIALIEQIEEETGVKVKFVPGNHDIWTDEESSWNSYELLKSHHSSLIDNPLEMPTGHVIIGDMGWYDFSFKPSFMNDEEVGEHKPNLWADALYAKWGMHDREVFEKMHQKIAAQLETFKDSPIIFVNHFLPYKDFLVFKNDLQWNTANAFMGAEGLGSLLDQYENVEYVVFGHTHKRFGLMEFGNKYVICNPLGYMGEWRSRNFELELQRAGVIVEL